MNRVSPTELIITRTFRALPRAVYDAWTRPELLQRWWAPTSRGVVLVECTADLRVGGSYHYVLARGPDARMSFHGNYLELNPPHRLVYTQSFDPRPGEVVVSMTLQANDEGTLFTALERYPSKETLDEAMGTGMEEGSREAFARLDALF